jgi:hypothetical protein
MQVDLALTETTFVVVADGVDAKPGFGSLRL